MTQQLFPTSPFLVPDPQGDARKAALVLHAMTPEDRAWLLHHLPVDQVSQLEVLLAELNTLGIPADQALLDQELVRKVEVPNPSSCREVEEGHRRRIRQADPDQVWEWLKDEPLGLVSRLLAVEPWPWTSHLLERFGYAKRQWLELHRSALGAADTSQAPPKELERALLRTLALRVVGSSSRDSEGPSHEMSLPVSRTWWHRLKHLPRNVVNGRLSG